MTVAVAAARGATAARAGAGAKAASSGGTAVRAGSKPGTVHVGGKPTPPKAPSGPDSSGFMDALSAGGQKSSSSGGGSSSSSPSKPSGGGKGKHGKGAKLPRLQFSGQRVLFAEFLLCVFILLCSPLTDKHREEGAGVFIRRGSAILALFFILALIGSGGPRAARAAAGLGGLVSVSLLVSSRSIFVTLAAQFNARGEPANAGDFAVGETAPESWAPGSVAPGTPTPAPAPGATTPGTGGPGNAQPNPQPGPAPSVPGVPDPGARPPGA